ncbi:phage minor head protein [Hydrogenophaga taeniospiralis]|uniref:phage head morphogenesis protein n=1 Tax=Hydrogenophaga taeniospiralis TaxID=65656 RepID=UPI001CFC2DDB|nr:phage minor head protein [Hydrogenophaga taeniospiralis]UCU94007.1 minor capsid protein [Hydrogenophaga taeniospiralis]
MTPAQAFAALRRLTPEGALAWLRDRGQITQTWSWADLRAEEHALQFTVSRLASVDLLAELRQMIIDSVAGDLTRTDFMKDARSALARKGWWGLNEVEDPVTGETVMTRFNPTRLKLIFDTNVRQAAVAGQWDRAQQTKRLFPYLRYVTLADEKVRDSHRAWHNLVLPVDDPWWNTHMPQNAYRCRCYVRQVSQREYDRGTTPTRQAMRKTAPAEKLREWENPRTGETLQVPDGVHPAFVGNPGKDRAAALQRASADKLRAVPPDLAAAARRLLGKGDGSAP